MRVVLPLIPPRHDHMKHLIAALVASLVAVGSALAAPRSSFDCRLAKEGAEQAICASEALARQDLAMAQSYERLRKGLDARAAAALQRDQDSFVRARDEAFGLPDEDLGQRLADRLAFLAALRPATSTGLVGLWGNVFGEVEVAAGEEGRLVVTVATADPVSGRWICNVGGSGSPSGDRLAATTSEDPDEEGWTLKLARAGHLLTLDETPPKSAADPRVRPFCGAGGLTAGAYFPLARRPNERRVRGREGD